jgi:hypothetical protein
VSEPVPVGPAVWKWCPNTGAVERCRDWQEARGEIARRAGPGRVVRKTKVGEVVVSTCFEPTGFGGEGESSLFETMIFGGAASGEQWRDSTMIAALASHGLAVELVLMTNEG